MEEKKDKEAASMNAWQDIHHGLKISMKAMQQAFSKVEMHFDRTNRNSKEVSL